MRCYAASSCFIVGEYRVWCMVYGVPVVPQTLYYRASRAATATTSRFFTAIVPRGSSPLHSAAAAGHLVGSTIGDRSLDGSHGHDE